jgi:DNA-binding SARP family transcriptional activator/tetratricopeptide (TPR) repeat protein
MAGLHLRLLGHMSVTDTKGRTFLPRTRKTRAMMAVLAMASPKPVLRVQLATLLWSRREQEQARASLRQSVHELQDTLGPDWSQLFITDRHHLSLRGSGLEIDANAVAQSAMITPALLSRFRDVLLEDMDGLDPAFDSWLGDARARFTRMGRAIGESILAASEDPLTTIEAAEHMLAFDRLHEGAWRAIIRSHAERGNLDAAIGSYDRCRGALAEANDGRKPSPETEELISRIRTRVLSGSVPLGRVLPETTVVQSAAGRVQRYDPSSLRVRIAPLRTLGDYRNDSLAIGLADEISAGLSRFRGISCFPAMPWPDHPADADAATGAVAYPWDGPAADLMLDGTIQHAAGRVRIIMRLIDIRAGGEIVWAGRFDREMTDSLSLQDELGATIVAQIDPELLRHEGRRTTSAQQHEMTGQELLLRALPEIYRLERRSFLVAGRLLEASLRIDPTNSVAHGWMAYWILLYIGQGWAPDPAASIAEAARLAERAVTLDPGDARALTLAGHVRAFLCRHPEEAIALHERALVLNPNLAIAWCFSGFAHSYVGDHEEALRRINQAVRLSPADPHVFFFDMARVIVHLMRGDYASAVEAGRRAIELNPLFSSTYKSYLSALGWMGREREATKVRDRLLALEPGFCVEDAIKRSPFMRPEDLERYAEGLRRAGLP